MRKIWLILLFVCHLASAINIKDVRVWSTLEQSEVVFESSKALKYKIDYAKDKAQVNITLQDTTASVPIERTIKDDLRLRAIRSRQYRNDLLIALELKARIRVVSFLAPPDKKYNHRLIIDLKNPVIESIAIKGKNELLVAIDAGHGGEDPGAIGPSGGFEKNVTLAIANKLSALLEKEPGFQSFMVRSGDYAVAPAQRAILANRNKCDLFISIHADIFKDSDAQGATVFVGNVTAKSHVANDLAAVLQGLTTTINQQYSVHLANLTLKNLGKTISLHSDKLQSENFLIFRYATMPAILLEAGFMSNPAEEKILISDNYQQQVAEAVLKALRTYKKTIIQ